MSVSSKATGLRYCPDCQTDQPRDNFTIRKTGRFVAYCKPCNAKRTATYRAENRDIHLSNKRAARRNWFETKSPTALRKNWDNLTDEEKAEARAGIYCITIGPKFYVGSCIHFDNRFTEHTRKLRNHRHFNKQMQQAFDLYEMFEMELIESCEPDDLVRLEQSYIDQWFDHEDCLNMKHYASRTIL